MSINSFVSTVAIGQMAPADWEMAPTPLRLLVVGADQRWTRVVTAAASRLGAAVVDTAGNSRTALSCVLRATKPYTLVLLQARRTDPDAEDLAELTAGDAGSGTGLLLLGDAGPLPLGGIVVEQATCAAISRALAGHLRNSETVTRDLTRAEMLDALAGPMLKLRYQPVVRLAERKTAGVEVLVRLEHPELGILSAEQFVPQMEAAGLSRQLTETVITRAMREACDHGLAQHGLLIGLNFPLNVLMMPDMIGLLETHRRQCAMSAGQIVIELTETQPVTDLDALRGVIRRLRDIGYRTCIDDATPEMENIDALLRIGFTTVKFDKSVVQSALHDPTSRGFIEQVVRTANAVGMQTVAEGIEDAATKALMRAMRVDSAQGYLMARPLPGATVLLWLEAWQAD